ncbi:MAG: hypothetical protein HZC50_05890 [Nitrospirae bacterium]|nr:hypothetical protein [Nitrospirota bacterium]
MPPIITVPAANGATHTTAYNFVPTNAHGTHPVISNISQWKSKTDSTGKLVWYVRLYHEGRERRFGSFPNKTQARDFYEKAKQEQKSGRFFPERYQRGSYELVEEMLSRYLAIAL